MNRKISALQMIALGMAFGAFNYEFEGNSYTYIQKKKSKPKKETLPEWFFWKNSYSAMDIFCDKYIPEGSTVVFKCRALNKQNAIKKAKKAGFL